MWGTGIDRFRKTNARLNELHFKEAGDTYRHYLTMIDQRLPRAGLMVDLGAGSVSLDDYLTRLKQDGICVTAVDCDYNGLASNHTSAKIMARAEALPFREATIDVVGASCFFEHVENPTRVLSECHRILKKGGVVVFYTPNRRSYVAAIARYTPPSFHRLVRMLQTGRESHDVEVTETFYRMNTRSEIVRQARDFRVVSLETYVGAPCYTGFMPPLVHLIFILYHKFLQKVSWLRRIFGESIIGCLVKP